MQPKWKNNKWELTTSKTEMDKLDSMIGWLKPLTELSTPIKAEAEAALTALAKLGDYLEENARPTTKET